MKTSRPDTIANFYNMADSCQVARKFFYLLYKLELTTYFDKLSLEELFRLTEEFVVRNEKD